MAFGLNDEQRLFQDQVRTLLAERATPDLLRKTITDMAAECDGVSGVARVVLQLLRLRGID